MPPPPNCSDDLCLFFCLHPFSMPLPFDSRRPTGRNPSAQKTPNDVTAPIPPYLLLVNFAHVCNYFVALFEISALCCLIDGFDNGCQIRKNVTFEYNRGAVGRSCHNTLYKLVCSTISLSCIPFLTNFKGLCLCIKVYQIQSTSFTLLTLLMCFS